jgi:hypothetical protein
VLRGLLQRPEISPFALASYRRELRAEAALPACYALPGGGFVGVLADRVFQLSPFGIALVSSSQLFGHLASASWARLGERVHRVPLINTLQFGVALLTAIPIALGVLLPLWAAYVDRVRRPVATHASEPRSAPTPVTASDDFAKPERAGAYLGVHATLTGVRGAFAPFLGVALYAGVSARELPGGVSLPALPAIGGWMMMLAAALSTVATLGLAALHRRIVAERSARRDA